MIKTKWWMVSVLALFVCLIASQGVSTSKVEASSSQWTVTYYSKANFQGSKVQKKVDNINFSWGTNAPIKGIPKDKFTAKMSKTLSVPSDGTYRIFGKANDGVKVYVDGIKQIYEWSKGSHTFSKDVKLSKGNHTIEVQYSDLSGTAFLNVDVKKVGIVKVASTTATASTLSTDKWTGKLFPSKNFTGKSVSLSSKTLNFTWGSKAPHKSIPAGSYSAIFEKKVAVSKDTKYILMGKANDGVRIYVDGKRQLSYWTAGTRNIEKNITLKKGTHTIKVEYFNEGGGATLKINLNESSKVTPLGKWDVSLYSKNNLTGNKVMKVASELDYKWGSAAPDSGIPSNNFSARFVKRMMISSGGGTYILSGGANDGVRIYVNGSKKIDYWKNGTHTFNQEIALTAGVTIIQVDYFDATGDARVQVNLTKKSKKKSVAYSTHDITLSSALTKQMSTSPKTDKKYGGYIPKDSVKLASTGTTGTVTKQVPIITSSARTLGTLASKAKVTIQGEESINDTDYYKIATGWVNASSADTKYYLNPATFNDTAKQEFFQYAKLSSFSALNKDEINQKILVNKGVLKNTAAFYLQAAFKYDVNEIYLISHSSLETGNGTSRLATGVKVKAQTDADGNFIYSSNGEKEITVLADDAQDYDAKVYNVYGIGAYDSNALKYGARRAYNEGWTSLSKAIIEGAKFAAETYIYAGQDTLYEMRWNPNALVTKGRPYHQYASDIGWAAKQTKFFEQLYSLLDSYTIEYDVPHYN